jgi:hypothetical protein
MPDPTPPPAPVRARRRRPAPDALDSVGAGLFWGGWIGALMEIVTLRRVRRRIRESRQRRGDRVREAAAARRNSDR